MMNFVTKMFNKLMEKLDLFLKKKSEESCCCCSTKKKVEEKIEMDKEESN